MQPLRGAERSSVFSVNGNVNSKGAVASFDSAHSNGHGDGWEIPADRSSEENRRNGQHQGVAGSHSTFPKALDKQQQPGEGVSGAGAEVPLTGDWKEEQRLDRQRSSLQASTRNSSRCLSDEANCQLQHQNSSHYTNGLACPNGAFANGQESHRHDGIPEQKKGDGSGGCSSTRGLEASDEDGMHNAEEGLSQPAQADQGDSKGKNRVLWGQDGHHLGYMSVQIADEKDGEEAEKRRFSGREAGSPGEHSFGRLSQLAALPWAQVSSLLYSIQHPAAFYSFPIIGSMAFLVL